MKMNKNKQTPPAVHKKCRISGEKLTPLFSLDALFVSDFLEKDQFPKYEPIPLEMTLAKKSGLVQLVHSAPADIMYRKYWYKSGTNATMTNELQGIIEHAQTLMRPKAGSIFVDIGCNDGTLFRFVKPEMIRIGFDPNDFSAESSVHASQIVNDYFTYKQYRATKWGAQKATIITSIAMFYDLEDPHAFVEDIRKTLDRDGLWILQMSYLPLMLDQLAFDNICHEHLEYYSLHALQYLLNAHDLAVVDCELNDVNGGSFRVSIRHKNADPAKFGAAPYRDVAAMRVRSTLALEKELKLSDPKTYQTFFKKITSLKKQTVAFIKAERAKGKVIWGYGASTKGNTLLQWFGLDNTMIDAIAERSPAKFGLKTVGTNIPIASEEEMRKAKPDYLLVLPWHFISEFISRETEFLQNGGKFIVPCPSFEVIGKEVLR